MTATHLEQGDQECALRTKRQAGAESRRDAVEDFTLRATGSMGFSIRRCDPINIYHSDSVTLLLLTITLLPDVYCTFTMFRYWFKLIAMSSLL